MKLQVGVKVLIRNKDGEYLFIKRSEPLPDGSGVRWDIPGGRIEPQEKLMYALKRELNEETGMKFDENPKLLDAQDIIISNIDLHTVRLTYYLQAEGSLQLSNEHVTYEWCLLRDAKSLNIDRYLRNTLSSLQ